jgi:MFS transporter, SP family, general alpha glucoside:H+ symporter
MDKMEVKTEINRRELLKDAEDATDQEHDLTFLQAIKLYPKAVGWSVLMSTALVMDGYDTKLIGSLFAQPAFQKAYGQLQANGLYQIPADWQTGLNNGSNVGQLFGLVIGGTLTEALGFRKTMMIGLAIAPCLIFIPFFAPSLPVLEVGQILLGNNLVIALFEVSLSVCYRVTSRNVSDSSDRICCRSYANAPSCVSN